MATQPELHSVDRHRKSVISRVTGVDSMLDRLCGQVLSEEQCQHVRAERTNSDKMQKLYGFLPSWSQDCKDQLYRGTKETHHHLGKELESLEDTSKRETPGRGLRKAVWILQGLWSRWNLPMLGFILALSLPLLLLQLFSWSSDAVSQQLSPWMVVPPAILSLLAGGIYFLWGQHRMKESLAQQLHGEKGEPQENNLELFVKRSEQAVSTLEGQRNMASPGRRPQEPVRPEKEELQETVDTLSGHQTSTEDALLHITDLKENHMNLSEDPLTKRENLPDKKLLSLASGGLALQGIYLTNNPNDLLDQREALIRVPEDFTLLGAEEQSRFEKKEFSCPQAEATFTQSMEKLGISLSCSEEGRGWSCELEIRSDFSKSSESRSSSRSCSEHTYSCTTQFSYVPLASAHLAQEQIRLSQEALEELKSIEDLVGLAEGPARLHALRSKCERFFCRFGSHINQGPLHLGGIFWWKAVVEGFREEQREDVRRQTCNALESYIRSGYSDLGMKVTAEVGGSLSEISFKSKETKSLQMDIQLSVTMTGGPSDVNSLTRWKAGMVASNKTWCVIDRGHRLLSVWDLILSNHRQDFQDVLQVSHQLVEAYTALTGRSDGIPCAKGLWSKEEEFSSFLADVKSWEVTDPEKQLKKLVDFMQKLKEQSKNDHSWSHICLSDRAVQDFLVNTATVCKDLPPQDTKLTRSHLRLLLDPHVHSVPNFPQAAWLLQWVCNREETQRPRTDGSEFAEFIQILKEIQKGVLRVDPDSVSPASMEEAQKQATAVVGSALSSLLQILRATDQSDTELLLLSIAAAAGYVAESQTFGGLLGREETNFLLQEMPKAHETHLALRRQCGHKAQAFLVLTGLTITSGPTALSHQQKEKRLSVMREHLGQSLSTEVADVLSRAGVDWESLERNLKSFIMGDGEVAVNSLTNDLGRREKESVFQDKKQMNGPTTGTRDEQAGSVSEQGERDNRDFLSLIQQLGLDRYYPRKMGRADFHLIYKASVHDSQPHTDQELPFYFLQKLLMLDYRLRYLVCRDDGKTTLMATESLSPTRNRSNSSDPFEDLLNMSEVALDSPGITKIHVHPMDVQMAIFHCADDFTRQYISNKLSICQFALPFVVPNSCTSQIEFPLWSLRQVKKSWRRVEKLGEEKKMKYNSKLICETATPIVSFLRVGNSFSSSKSQLLNSLLSKQKHDIFFHRHCRGSSKDVLLMGGVVEVCWYCPGGKDDDSFDNCITFTNLHGDAIQHEAQLRFLQEISSVTVVLLSAFEESERNRQIVRELWRLPKPLICLFDDREKMKGGKRGLKVKIGIKSRNEAELMEELRATITHLLEVQGTALSPVGCAEIARRHGFLVDEDRKECKEAETLVQTLVSLLTENKLSAVKEKFLPLQGELWHRWCKKDRELSHLRGKGNKNIEQHRSEIEAEKQEIRNTQLHKAFPLNDLMRSVVDILQAQSKTNSKLYFLQWLSIFMDNLTAGHLEILQQKYDGLWSQMPIKKEKGSDSDPGQHLQGKLEVISKEIDDSTIGIDHFLREIGQIYEAVDKHSPEKDTLMHSLPQIAADLMVAGYPLELMDGDASYVPLKWVAAVFDRLTETLGDKRLFVLSVLGLQSSGKSTLLNAMFGLQFAVSAGRCTRGAYMQLLEVQEKVREDLGFDFVLVVDTEGLRAPELANKSLNHDNELATFVIGLGNLTVINIFGENPSEMQDILQIAVQAFLRMKKVRLSPSCVFVHQNVGEVTANDQNREGRRRLQQRLDEMAAAAAEQEQISDITRFSDVIRFDVNTHVHFFSHLWEGNPPMAPPNPSYSHNVQDLKSWILTVAKEESQGRILRLTGLKNRVQDLWRALVNENFIFSFRNTREIVAMSKLETVYNGWTWKLRSHTLALQNELNNQIQNGKIKNLTACHLEGPVSEKYMAIQQELEKYFDEDEDSEILIQWKASFATKLQILKGMLVSETRRRTEELITFKISQSELDKKKSEYENELLDRSRELALSLQGKEFCEKELRVKFDDVWSKWVTKLSSTLPLGNDPDISLDLENILLNHFQQEHNIADIIGDISRREIFSIDYSKYVKMNKKYHIFNLKLYKFTLEEGDEMNIRKTTEQITDIVNEIIGSKEKLRAGYHSSFFHEILRAIDTEVDSASRAERYTFTNQYKLDLSMHLCQTAVERFRKMHKAFKRANDPVTYLESKREDFFMSFKISCQGAISITDFADFLWDKVSSALLRAVWGKTAIDLAGDMRSNFLAFKGNRSNLEKHILISLVKEESFENYWQYIHSPRAFFKNYIKKRVEAYCSARDGKKLKAFVTRSVQSFKADILAAINQSTDATKTRNGSVSMWLDEFCQRLGGRLTLPRGDLKSIEHQEIKDIEFLREAVIRAVNGPPPPALQMGEPDWAGRAMEEVVPKVQKMLSDQLCGCWKQCPFCKAICTNTVTDHDGDHSVPFHRSKAVNGFNWHQTDNFSIDFCTSSVASDCNLVFKDGRSIPYKSYRQAGGEYATWSITPDTSAQPYWKWFLCRFRAQLEEKYNKRFKGQGEIPHAWTRITKEEVIADLNSL